jgi:hypothetical protein
MQPLGRRAYAGAHPGARPGAGDRGGGARGGGKEAEGWGGGVTGEIGPTEFSRRHPAAETGGSPRAS